jgi:hypothetical protein
VTSQLGTGKRLTFFGSQAPKHWFRGFYIIKFLQGRHGRDWYLFHVWPLLFMFVFCETIVKRTLSIRVITNFSVSKVKILI